MKPELLLSGAKELGIDLSTQQLGKFQEYFNLLMKWSKSINLTAISNPDEVVIKHFLDSLTLVKFINSPAKLIDIGTGAGFPGIPLKIALPDLDITLVDSTAKKIGFLDLIIRSLKLDKCTTIHARAEDLKSNPEFATSFDYVTARALASADKLFLLLKPFVTAGGQILMLKGAEATQEVACIEEATPQIIPLTVPGLDARRTLIKFRF